MLAAEAARERFDEELAEVELEVAMTGTPPGLPRPTDMLSGGTMQSMAEVTGDPDAERIVDPGVLITDPGAAAAVAAASPIRLAPRRGFSGAVLAPMSPAAFINPAVIHRSAAIAADDRGEDFRPFVYREGVAFRARRRPCRCATPRPEHSRRSRPGSREPPAAGRPPASGSDRGCASSSRTRASARPQTASRRGAGGWRCRRGPPAAQVVSVAIDADGHPGYLATARMMGEAGLLLAEPGATPERAGYLTPATALGTGSAERFARAGLRFSVD